jgi:DNA-binding NarL/FixJ family response regulator
MCYTILLVDDDSSLTSSISAYLSGHGFQLKSANSISKALDLLSLYKPDLIISDIVMPKQNGYDFIKLIKKKQYSQVPFIFLTAKGMTKDRIIGYELGCYGYLVKPFDPEELVAMIKSILKRSRNSFISNYTDAAFTYSSKYNINRKIFTVTEEKVLRLVIKGLTNKEISEQLSFSTRNIEKYVSRLLAKTKTRNRTHLAQYCCSLNLNFLEGE